MKYIKKYELFGGLKSFIAKKIDSLRPKVYNNIDDILSDASLSHKDRVYEIDKLCIKYKINYTLNEDYSIDCGIVNLSNMGLTEIPLKFNKAHTFRISNNKIKSLKNSPIEVGYFYAEDNQIESLEFCPKEVGSLRLSNNNIKSIDGLPMDCRFIDLGHNQISDISNVINLSTSNDYFNVSNNKVVELYPLNGRKVFLTYCPAHLILMRVYSGIEYPDDNWIELFNSYNIIYNDGIGKPKLFTDNLLNFIPLGLFVLRRFIDSLKDDGDFYEVTTMEEYFNK